MACYDQAMATPFAATAGSLAKAGEALAATYAYAYYTYGRGRGGLQTD